MDTKLHGTLFQIKVWNEIKKSLGEQLKLIKKLQLV
jgi:hypothetical protein